ncbi:MAG: hypothetical protein AAF493_12715 [Pseudomonadota bacterium]
MSNYLYQDGSIRVRDAQTSSALRVARSMVGENYATLSSASIEPEWVEARLTDDRFDHERVTHTLLAETAKGEPLGTMRLVLGDRQAPQPFEFLDLMQPPIGWDEFTVHYSIDQDFEIGRFAFSRQALCARGREERLHLKTLRALTLGVGRMARSYGRRRAWMIASQKVANAFRRSGLLPVPIPGPLPNWSRHHAMFEQFDRYWRDGGPLLYTLRGWEVTWDAPMVTTVSESAIAPSRTNA